MEKTCCWFINEISAKEEFERIVDLSIFRNTFVEAWDLNENRYQFTFILLFFLTFITRDNN